MKKLARWLTRVYPRWWRTRYGREFEALLDDSAISVLDLVGVVRSALEMRMKTTSLPHIVSLASRDIPHGHELESAVELPQPDGSTMLVRNFCREIDLDGSYVTLNHWSRDAQPAQTVLVFGRKGEVEGDFRTDETEMLVLRPDGTIQRTEQTVKTWLKYDAIRDGLRDRYRNGMQSGLTPDEIFQRIRAEN